MKKLSPAARRYLGLGFVVAFVLLVGTVPATANPGGTGLVISQVYGGGGNTNAQYTQRFHRDLQPDRSDRFPSPAGPFSTRAPREQATSAATPDQRNGSRPGQYYLVQEAAGTGTPAPLPTPDATGTDRHGGEQPARSRSSTARPRSHATVGSTACSDAQRALIADLVGFGTRELLRRSGRRLRTLSNTTAAFRASQRAARTQMSTSRDFAAAAPAPRNTRLAHERLLGRRRHDPLDQRRLAERGQLGHDDLHVHRQPLGGGRSQRGHLRHRTADGTAGQPATTPRSR